MHNAIGCDFSLVYVLHHDVECFIRMLCCPFPALPAGLGETKRLILVLGIVLTSHIDTIFLHVVTMIAETVYILVVCLYTCLYQLVVFIVAHGQRGIEGTREEEIDILCKANPLVIQMVLDAHADGQLSEVHTPDAHTGTLLSQRILTTSRDNYHSIIHRCL